MDEDSGGGSSWESWFQNIAGTLVNGYVSANYTQPYELERLRISARNQDGLWYQEGQPGTAPERGAGLAISPNILLMAGALLLVVLMLKD